MRILGIVTDTHDSGIALLRDGVPEIVIEEERLNRKKHTQRFPARALDAALTARGLSLADIDALATPWDISRLRRTFAAAVLRRLPASWNLIRKDAHPTQRNEIVFLNQRLRYKLRGQFATRQLPPLYNVGHHDAHAALFFVSPFEDATVLVMDGYGDDASTSVYTGAGGRLNRHWHLGMFNSLGMIYTFVTHYLGFAGFADEGKVMALAAFGGPTYDRQFRDVIALIDDGRYAIDMSYFSYDAYGMLQPFGPKFIETFGPPRQPGEPLTQRHKDIAHALQLRTEEVILHICRALSKAHPSRNLVLTGGVALNCIANARVLAETDYAHVWVPPVASDSGAPLGAALWHHHQTLGRPRSWTLRSAALGLSYTDEQIRAAIAARGLTCEHLTEDSMIERAAQDLAAGRVLGWFQGRFEMGPRALGHRSILADPRSVTMRDTINQKIKRREGFRPFAPAILRERVAEFFEFDDDDPFMTMAPRAKADKAHLLAAGIHVDHTGRIQTVDRDTNPRYWRVIEAFGRRTGVPALLNTSFNEQEPIVNRPEEAIDCYLRTDMDALVLETFYLSKR
ncbi:MAG: carbamoyltransferase [Hyphomicrobiaceae bacterium]